MEGGGESCVNVMQKCPSLLAKHLNIPMCVDPCLIQHNFTYNLTFFIGTITKLHVRFAQGYIVVAALRPSRSVRDESTEIAMKKMNGDFV